MSWKNKYFITLLSALCLYGSVAFGQQALDFNFYAQNPYLINPAYSGYRSGIQTFAWANSSFQGIEGAPRSFMLGIQSALERDNFGVGGRVHLDQRGIYESFVFDFATSYKLLLNNFQLISFGIDAGFVNNSFNTQALNGQVDTDDMVLTSDIYNKTSIKMGFGVGYLNQKMQVGISFPRLVEGGESTNTSFMAHGAYNFQEVGSIWSFRPSILIQSFNDGTQQYEGNLAAIWEEIVWGQLGYKSSKTISLAAGLRWQRLDMAYHFNLPIGGGNDFFVNNHEILLNMSFARHERLAFIREKRTKRKPKRN